MDSYEPFKSHQSVQRSFYARLILGALIMIVLSIVMFGRYYYLQVVSFSEFMTRSESNRVLVKPISPRRGSIYDRNGVILAKNRSSFNLSVVKERAGNVKSLVSKINGLVDLSELETDQFYKQLKRRRRPYQAVPLKLDLSEEDQAILAVNQHDLKGMLVTTKLLREYPFALQTAHTLGYVGRINDRENNLLDPVLYSGTFVVGKTGLEKKYEDELIGRPGYQTVEINNRGRIMRQLEREDPLDGKDLHLHLDYRLQHKAFEALKGEKGAVVVIEVDTGGVLAMVSAPSFDSGEFVTGMSYGNYSALASSSDQPLFDRVLRGQYPPGSIVKPLFALAALDKKVITKRYSINDPGYFQLPNSKHKYRDWKKGGHGNAIYLNDAIIQSCDTFFYNLSTLMPIDIFYEYGSSFGLGEKTGIDMPFERSGIMPSRSWKKKNKNQSWYAGDTINTSIGQGFTLATPMQLAVMTAGIASQGKIRVPQLVRNPKKPSSLKRKVEISKENWKYVHQAMNDVVHSSKGTARGISRGLNYHIAGKTGTVQVVGIKQKERYNAATTPKHHRDHAFFSAFAPKENPKIAIIVVIENGGSGSSQAAPVAREIIDAYMNFYPETPKVKAEL
jgi:penicillin-binding protein 2